MNSFLITIDRSGKITEIIWSEPIYIIARQHLLFSESFVTEQREELQLEIDKCIQSETLLQCNIRYILISNGAKMRMYMLPMIDNIIVFAWDEQNIESANLVISFQSIILKFMNAIKNYSTSNVFHNTKSITLQFERIQKLNNDLINTERMLEKANGQLALLNQELNNRLVKDALTGLVSRYQYYDEIAMFINREPEKLGVFVFIDIDDFKSVNDKYGHAVGDQYLIGFADRLKKLLFENTIKMRISGDEFGLFLFGLTNIMPDQMDAIWQEIRARVLFGPIETVAGEIPISISAGMAVYGKDTNEIFQLIEYADFAMYMAKNNGKNGFQIFDIVQYENVKGERNEER